MHPLYTGWPYALVFWGVFLWVFTPEFRIIVRKPPARPVGAPSQDAGSKLLIMLGQNVAVFVAFGVAWAAPAWAIAHAEAAFWTGLALMVAGSLLRRHCFRTLGASFTGEVIVRPDQVVVDRGAYHYVRHPSYAAAVLIFAGIGLALGNWLSLAVVLIGCVVAYGYRVHVEERALASTIGEPYRMYMRRTKRFVPFVF